METETIQKNEVSPKNLRRSRVNFLLCGMALFVFLGVGNRVNAQNDAHIIWAPTTGWEQEAGKPIYVSLGKFYNEDWQNFDVYFAIISGKPNKWDNDEPKYKEINKNGGSMPHSPIYDVGSSKEFNPFTESEWADAIGHCVKIIAVDKWRDSRGEPYAWSYEPVYILITPPDIYGSSFKSSKTNITAYSAILSGSGYKYTSDYGIRYREITSYNNNWIEVPNNSKITDLKPCTNYEYEVYAKYSGPYIKEEHKVITGGWDTFETRELSAPTKVTAVQNGSSVNISWDGVQSATGYIVYRCRSLNGSYELAHLTPITTTSFKDDYPYDGASYYKVVAISQDGWCSSDYSTPASANYNATVPVTGVTISNCPNGNLTVGQTHQLSKNVFPNNATNKAVTWKSSNTTVAAVSDNGLVTAKAKGNATITVTTTDGNQPATCNIVVGDVTVPTTCFTPTNVTHSPPTTTGATISWTAASTAPASGYQVYVSTSSTAPSSATAATANVSSGISYKYDAGNQNTTYYVWVRSNCGGGKYSDWANGGSFKTADNGTGTDAEAVAEAVAIIVNNIHSVTQNYASTDSEARAWLAKQINDLIASTGVTTSINDIRLSNFKPALNGDNGSFAFTVSLTKGNASDRILSKRVTITAMTVYTITVEPCKHGSVSANKRTAAQDETVTITFARDYNYPFASISAKRTDIMEDLKLVESKFDSWTLTFTMPASDVIIAAIFKTNTSIDEAATKGLQIYPNPAQNEIFIQSDLHIEKVEIVDFAGRTVETHGCASLQNGTVTINISTIPQGVYMVKVYTDNGVAVRKIVKE